MKIRELEIYGLRNFPPEGRRISFVDPYSDRPRQLTVLVGSNGSGKTTVLAAITTMIGLIWEEPQGVLIPPRMQGRVVGRFELDDKERDLYQTDRIGIVFGRTPPSSLGIPLRYFAKAPSAPAPGQIDPFYTEPYPPRGPGYVIFMPHERAFPAAQSLQIAAPAAVQEHAIIAGRHSGASLPQLWFWQNYLDLEAHAEGRPNLTPFIDAIEDLLGHGQRVRIKRGRVTIERPHLGDVIEPHELPSGELQVLTLFGELLRHLRPGAIVLIDELEISLHPALQRAVIHKLRALARKHDLQVILTTHSMEVVSSVAPQEVVLLDNILMQEGIEPGAKAG